MNREAGYEDGHYNKKYQNYLNSLVDQMACHEYGFFLINTLSRRFIIYINKFII